MVRKSRKGREEWKIYGNVFDEFTNRNLFNLASQGHFTGLKSSLALGKEANVFYAEKKDGSPVIVKIYRLENCNFNKMYSYISSDPRFQQIENQKRKIVFSWVQREYRNLLLAREKIKVPTPYAFKDNILVMEYIGDESAALQLKDSEIDNPKEYLKSIIKDIKLLIDAKLVHGDLSGFNILNDNGKPVIIDFSQATVISAPGARELLERDIRNVCIFFSKRIEVDTERIVADVLKYFDRQSLKG